MPDVEIEGGSEQLVGRVRVEKVIAFVDQESALETDAARGAAVAAQLGFERPRRQLGAGIAGRDAVSLNAGRDVAGWTLEAHVTDAADLVEDHARRRDALRRSHPVDTGADERRQCGSGEQIVEKRLFHQ